jgi:hypothetical protein
MKGIPFIANMDIILRWFFPAVPDFTDIFLKVFTGRRNENPKVSLVLISLICLEGPGKTGLPFVNAQRINPVFAFDSFNGKYCLSPSFHKKGNG